MLKKKNQQLIQYKVNETFFCIQVTLNLTKNLKYIMVIQQLTMGFNFFITYFTYFATNHFYLFFIVKYKLETLSEGIGMKLHFGENLSWTMKQWFSLADSVSCFNKYLVKVKNLRSVVEIFSLRCISIEFGIPNDCDFYCFFPYVKKCLLYG